MHLSGSFNSQVTTTFIYALIEIRKMSSKDSIEHWCDSSEMLLYQSLQGREYYVILDVTVFCTFENIDLELHWPHMMIKAVGSHIPD